MKTSIVLSFIVSVSIGAAAPAPVGVLNDLKILYVGSERADQYVDFLKGKVARVEAISRAAFKPKDAAEFDVVLLDWRQSGETREMRKDSSPLGARDEWSKPTVLLGSAGLNLAVAWKMKGGSGCTCLDPLAYDVRDHEIFSQPYDIHVTETETIPTPEDFKEEISDPEIKVLPLVPGLKRHGRPGWCTYSNDFARYPDVEFFCGGVNHKTPTAAALWRQGNLLHFGFEESPSEMNKTGQMMLLNSIVYISRFSEDRPIAVTPSVFGGPVARSRKTLAKWLRNKDFKIDFAQDLVAPDVWNIISALTDREEMAKWADQNGKFLHPNDEQRLAIDEDLQALGLAFDEPAFFKTTLADLKAKDSIPVERAARLLHRYAPDGPNSNSADEWAKWWKDNEPYVFASDAGDYRWYIDPLAKKRGIPSAELRGPRRADATSQSATSKQ